MDKNEYKVLINDQEVTLKFNWGSTRKLGVILGKDPLLYLQENQWMNPVDFAQNIIEASSSLTSDEVKTWVESLGNGEAVGHATKIIDAFNKSFTVAGGETGENTQQPPAA